jgi:hypothetical protein
MLLRSVEIDLGQLAFAWVNREVRREMSNHLINPFGGGRRPALRSPRIRRGGGTLCLMVGLLVCASSAITAVTAEAAEIVEVRIGRHAEFTRVVFELDRAAGYRIERSDPKSDVAELVISFEASSIPRRLKSSKSLIAQVEVEPSGRRSIARIRLSKNGLKLKEMILASPPRIVLDFLSDKKAAPLVAKTVAKTAVKPKAKPVPAPKEEAVPSFDEPTFDEIVAENSAEPEPAPVVAPKPVVVAPKPVVVEPVVVVEPEPVVVAAVEPAPSPSPAPTPTPTTEVVAADEPSTSTPIEEPGTGESDQPEVLADRVADSRADATAQVEPVTPPTRTPRPMVVKSKPSTDEGGGWMTWALAGIGVIALLLGGALVARRRKGDGEVDFADEGQSDSGDADTVQAENDENPFGNLSSDDQQMTLGTPEASTATPFGTDSGDTTIVSLTDEEKESESVVFGDSEENSMDEMEVISRDQVNQSLGGMPSATGGIPEEFQQMMREMNRRVESLEGRIDELVDARDRLERQVAAQTEELRVQRAAIARTQRAVRNLARPEDEDGEQEPTEPALRDPNATS